MKILFCGGREFNDMARVAKVMGDLMVKHGRYEVITGGQAKGTPDGYVGADFLVGYYALVAQLPLRTYPANWTAYGKAAGPIRNGEMLQTEQPDLVVAFTGGAGTADMVTKAQAAGVEVEFA